MGGATACVTGAGFMGAVAPGSGGTKGRVVAPTTPGLPRLLGGAVWLGNGRRSGPMGGVCSVAPPGDVPRAAAATGLADKPLVASGRRSGPIGGVGRIFPCGALEFWTVLCGTSMFAPCAGTALLAACAGPATFAPCAGTATAAGREAVAVGAVAARCARALPQDSQTAKAVNNINIFIFVMVPFFCSSGLASFGTGSVR